MLSQTYRCVMSQIYEQFSYWLINKFNGESIVCVLLELNGVTETRISNTYYTV